MWSFDGLTGDIQRETGTLADGALDTGAEYEIARFEGVGKSDIYDLMNQRETVEYEELDSYGGATSQSKLSEVQTPLTFTVYEPVDNVETTETEVQIRVCDGELQWLSKDGWVPLGTLEELAETDLFQTYAEEKVQYDEAIRQAQAEAEPESEETVETPESTEESQTATTTTRPTQNTTNTTTTTPATTSTTETTPSTQDAETTPEPAQTNDSDDDDDNDDNSSDSTADNSNNNSSADTGSTNTGTTDTGSTDSGTTDTGTTDTGTDDNSGDTDVEWTEDLL